MHIEDSIYQAIVECLPILCVDLLVIHEGRCLLLRRANHPAFGEWWFPGGRVQKDEMMRDAAVRIAREETGLVCSFREIVGVEETIFSRSEHLPAGKHTVNVCCRMDLLSPPGALVIDGFHDAAGWFDHVVPDWHVAVRRPMERLGFVSATEATRTAD